MNYKKQYPVTIKQINDSRRQVIKIFSRIAPHRGTFIGVCELEGCFLADNADELYESLFVGERLCLKECGETAPFEVNRASGEYVGTLPHADSVLPGFLIRRGIEVFCYVEAVERAGGLLAVGISLYCDEY